MRPAGTQPRCSRSAEDRAQSREQGPGDRDVPYGVERDEETRIGREAAKEAGDHDESGQVVGVVVGERSSKRLGGGVDADQIDQGQDPGDA